MNVREWALPVYTILTELATGTLLILWITRSLVSSRYGRQQTDQAFENPILVVFFTIGVGMLGAHFHLSKPYLSFLSVLNFHASWLSREIIFNVLFFLAVGWLLYLQWQGSEKWFLKTSLGWLAVFLGIATIYCMARIYMLPTQEAWNTPITVVSFFSNALLLGFMALASLLVMDSKYSEIRSLAKVESQSSILQLSLPWFTVGVVIVAGILIAEHIQQLSFLEQSEDQTALVSIMLLTQLYPFLFGMQIFLIVFGVVGFSLTIIWQRHTQKPVSDLLVPIYMTCLLVMIGGILGRFLFYATHVRVGI